jgi:prefoldin subunit 5
MGPAYVSAADEMEMLRAEADYLKNSLESINKRMDELEKRPAEEA